jgi:DnaJ-class molecular chaperone
MNYKKACEILTINSKEEITKNVLKRQYRLKALKYHPDKNNDVNASEKFQEIHDAYEYLLNKLEYVQLDSDDDYDFEEGEDLNNLSNYNNLLFQFVKNIFGKESSDTIYQIILNKIANTCENKAIQLLEKLEKPVLINICEMIHKYKDAFHFSHSFFDKLEEMTKKKIKDDECIILNPLIDDLFNNNLYKLIVGEYTYIVPLWHHELIYDNSGRDIYIRCVPILEDGLCIDNKNNIIVSKTYNILDVWQKERIEIKIGSQTFEYPVEKLKMANNQQIILEKQGISKINTINVYDVSKQGDIIINITIT